MLFRLTEQLDLEAAIEPHMSDLTKLVSKCPKNLPVLGEIIFLTLTGRKENIKEPKNKTILP